MVDGRTTDGRTTDGRRLDGYTLISPCEPNGSGELKIQFKIIGLPVLERNIFKGFYHI